MIEAGIVHLCNMVTHIALNFEMLSTEPAQLHRHKSNVDHIF